jgi:hypothetical protein
MSKPSLLDQYLQHYSASDRWKLIGVPFGNVSQVVVIPAYAEKDMLFQTLVSLARNYPESLKYSFVVCVINNKVDAPDEVKINNRQTIEYLSALVEQRGSRSFAGSAALKESLQVISDSGLQLGYIDASTAGYEIPANDGGVGMARKIGMDMALRLLHESNSEQKLILSLDADTLVRNNYLPAVKNYFSRKTRTAIVAYEHSEPPADKERAAIYCYEIFLRYWVLGLRYAKSPYAFHSIGSTIICSADAYLNVRGMNRREAAEDFYFLNKLAKNGGIRYIRETCVYPSARISTRVPFGTGKRMQRFLTGVQDEYVLDDPRIFEILGQWLSLMKPPFLSDEQEILKRAGLIDPLLSSFLIDCKFTQSWSRIRRNFKDEDNLSNHFHSWFDGFKTLKLINYLARKSYAPVNMFTALDSLLRMNRNIVPDLLACGRHPELGLQKKIIQYLRKIT